jgi:hypothetical protein
MLSSAGLPQNRRGSSRRSSARKIANKPKPSTAQQTWNSKQWQALHEIGEGMAVVFSPDIARPANELFYTGLGFLYIETSDWMEVIDQIRRYNQEGPSVPIKTLIMETHGNHGHGLKLQTGKGPNESRSYISLGALQELLAGSGVQQCILSACNTGRLLRPNIYYKLDEKELLPANHGIINASPGFNAAGSEVKLLRRRESRLEMISTVLVSELTKSVRDYLAFKDLNVHFVLSDLFIQYVLGDPGMRLTELGYTDIYSKSSPTPTHSERLIKRFISTLDKVAAKSDSDLAAD